jgi:hypothetical protein
MRRFGWVVGVLVFGLAGALVGVVPDGVSAVAAKTRCRATAFVTNVRSDSVSTIADHGGAVLMETHTSTRRRPH